MTIGPITFDYPQDSEGNYERDESGQLVPREGDMREGTTPSTGNELTC